MNKIEMFQKQNEKLMEKKDLIIQNTKILLNILNKNTNTYKNEITNIEYIVSQVEKEKDLNEIISLLRLNLLTQINNLFVNHNQVNQIKIVLDLLKSFYVNTTNFPAFVQNITNKAISILKDEIVPILELMKKNIKVKNILTMIENLELPP